MALEVDPQGNGHWYTKVIEIDDLQRKLLSKNSIRNFAVTEATLLMKEEGLEPVGHLRSHINDDGDVMVYGRWQKLNGSK